VEPARLYLDLVKRMLLREDFEPVPLELRTDTIRSATRYIYSPLQRLLRTRGIGLTAATESTAGETMLSRERLENLQLCVESVIADDISGDLIETGVWRGGATILMRAVLAAHVDTTRTVWVADSFEGFPNARLAIDRVDYTAGAGNERFAVSVDEVRRNFARYNLLDDQVRFLVGWFSDTLPTAPIERLAVLRLDGDMYESTRDAIEVLYPKLSPGGYLIVDDYGTHAGSRQAIDEYRAKQPITESVEWIDTTCVFWRRGGSFV